MISFSLCYRDMISLLFLAASIFILQQFAVILLSSLQDTHTHTVLLKTVISQPNGFEHIKLNCIMAVGIDFSSWNQKHYFKQLCQQSWVTARGCEKELWKTSWCYRDWREGGQHSLFCKRGHPQERASTVAYHTEWHPASKTLLF